MTDVDPAAVLTALLDHARATGVFEVTRVGEFKNAPPNALCFAVWAEGLGALAEGGGLAVTGALLTCTARIYHPALSKPESDAEVKVLSAASAYLGRLSGGFTLGGAVRNVDLLGQTGDPLTWRFGYGTIDAKMSRIADLSIRVIMNDAWIQSE